MVILMLRINIMQPFGIMSWWLCRFEASNPLNPVPKQDDRGIPSPILNSPTLFLWSQRCQKKTNKKTAWIISPWSCAVLYAMVKSPKTGSGDRRGAWLARCCTNKWRDQEWKGCHWKLTFRWGKWLSKIRFWGILFSQKRSCSHLRVYDRSF